MGKKSNQAAMKTPNKQEKRQQTHSLMKILRPKVFITDSSNFKNLVQELTGNGSSPVSSPPPRTNSAASPPPAFVDHAYHENFDVSFDSSCFSTPLEGSPDLRPLDSLDYGFDFSSQIMDLESLLMGIDSINYSNSNAYDSWSAPIQQEVCAYDYDFSSLI